MAVVQSDSLGNAQMHVRLCLVDERLLLLIAGDTECECKCVSADLQGEALWSGRLVCLKTLVYLPIYLKSRWTENKNKHMNSGSIRA